MSRRVRAVLVIGCLVAGLLHLPRALSCVRAGLDGPIPAAVAHQDAPDTFMRTARESGTEETRGDGLGT